MILLYFNGWTTAKKSRRFLEDLSLDFKIYNYSKEGFEKSDLKKWFMNSKYSIQDLLSKRTKLYKELNIGGDISNDELEDLICKYPMLIKRPVLIINDTVEYIGFSLKNWEQIVRK